MCFSKVFPLLKGKYEKKWNGDSTRENFTSFGQNKQKIEFKLASGVFIMEYGLKEFCLYILDQFLVFLLEK